VECFLAEARIISLGGARHAGELAHADSLKLGMLMRMSSTNDHERTYFADDWL
jgi:hypothetical protein